MSGRPAPTQWQQPVDLLAWEVHYLDHLAPLWHALSPARRGSFYAQEALIEHAASRGVEAITYTGRLPGLGPVVVASYMDLKRAWVNGEARPLVLSEHGAGFRFGSRHPSYAGGGGLRENVGLYLCVNKYVSSANRRTHPEIPSALVGCPKLDKWHNREPKRRDDPPTIAISFHWDSAVAPEARSAWEHYKSILPELATRYRLLGHAHPRMLARLRPEYEALGIEVVSDFEDILARADLYINDASSTLYEFASLGRPVVVLNAPWYRREVKFGLRWWEHADVGVNCDEPGDLLAAIETALADSPEQQEKRCLAVDAAYPVRGNAAELAAAAILEYRPRTLARKPAMPPQQTAPERPDPIKEAVNRAIKLPGHMSRGELSVLARMALSARNIVELGVWQGRSLAGMMLANPDATYTGVDWFQDMSHLGYPGSSPQRVRENLAILGIFGGIGADPVDLIVAPTDEAAMEYSKPIDFLHVDAGHSVEEVMADILLWLPKVRVGGAVAFYDYGEPPNPVLNRPGVTNTVDSWRSGDWAEVERDGRQVAFRHMVADQGVLYIAYGDRARAHVQHNMETLRELAPDLPVAVVSDTPLDVGEVFIWHPDIHPGARSQKTRMYSLSPFRETLYMDADTELLSSPLSAFGLLEWFDAVMGVDLAGTVEGITYRHLNQTELEATKRELPCSEVLYYNSGVIAFRRSDANQRLFQAWHAEWLRWQQQDQLALTRALYANPVRIATMRTPFNSNKREVAQFVYHAHHAVRRVNAPK